MRTVSKHPSRPGFGATKGERTEFALFELTEPLRRNARTIAHQFVDARRKISGHNPDLERLARRLYVALANFLTIRNALHFAGRGAPMSRTQIEERLHLIARDEAAAALGESADIDRLTAADVDRSNAA
jgi:hypothetical protein